MLRPFTQIDQSSAGRTGTYFIATRLYPLFQQFAPELAPAISAQLAALGSQTSQANIASSDWLNQGMTPDKAGNDDIAEELKDRLSRAADADARDRAYAFAALRAADAGDAQAREYADKIEDTLTRNGIRTFVDYRLIEAFLKKKNVEAAVELARKTEVTRAQCAHVLIQAGEIVARTDRVRAMELLGDALAEARRIDAGTPDRAYALIAILAQYSKLDKLRGWELLDETIRAANGIEDFTGEDGQASVLLAGKLAVQVRIELAKSTDLSNSFAGLTDDDLYRAINVAKSFNGEAPRSLATLAVARAVLQDKKN